MVSSAKILLTSVLAVSSLPGCNLGNYPSLGERRDETEVLGSGATTWVAFETTKVTLLVLGARNGTTPAGFALTELGGVSGDQSVTGTYEVGEASEELTLSATVSYRSNGGTSASGNARTSVNETLVFSYRLDDDQLILSGTTPVPRLQNFQSVASKLDTTNANGARCAIELLHLTTGSAELRIPGFGGLGTIEYSRPAVFRGQIAGSVRLSLSDLLSPLTEFDYDDYSDFSGYATSGTKATKTDTGGDGFLYGTLRFAFDSAPVETADSGALEEVLAGDAGVRKTLSGEVQYGKSATNGIRLQDGNETGGSYTVSFDRGGTFTVPYDAPSALHLVDCFPE